VSESLIAGVTGIRGLAVLVLVVEVETKKSGGRGKGGFEGVNEATTGEITLERTLGGIEVEGTGDQLNTSWCQCDTQVTRTNGNGTSWFVSVMVPVPLITGDTRDSVAHD